MLRCSAHKVGEQLSPALVLYAQDSWVETSVAGGTPLSTIFAAAKVGEEEAAGLFDKRAQLLRLESKKGSLRSVTSGLKAWHGFAEQVLDLPVYSNPTSKD